MATPFFEQTTTLRKFKPLTESDQFKGYLTEVPNTLTTYNANDLRWNMVSKTATTWSLNSDEYKHFFERFGMNRDDTNPWFRKIEGVADQFNAKRMLFINLNTSPSGTLDGSTLEVRVPTGTTPNDYVTFFGSNYVGEAYSDGNLNYIAASSSVDDGFGEPICYLFPNTTAGAGAIGSSEVESGWVYPYSGSVDGKPNPNADYITSWDPDINSIVPHLKATHPNNATDEGFDHPYGIAFLNSGNIVLFDIEGRTDFLSAISALSSSGDTEYVWRSHTNFSGFVGTTDIANTDNDLRTDIYFSGSAADVNALVKVRDITNTYKMTYFCHAATNEFNSSSNQTYNHAKAYYTPESADDVYVSEVALYGSDISRGPIAIAKINPPVTKSFLDTVTLKVDITV